MAKEKPAQVATADDAEGESAAPKKSGFLSRKLVIMVAAGLLVAGGGGGGYFFFKKGHSEEKAAPVVVKAPPAFLDLPDVLVNLQSQNNRSSYLKAKIVLEVADQKIAAAKRFGRHLSVLVTDIDRSEERRVGKECRSRWSPYH